jgi:DNA-directed RNA polymerase specialized sigma24 family protein
MVFQMHSRAPGRSRSRKHAAARRFLDSVYSIELSKRDRDALWMLSIGGASQAEVAQITGMQLFNVSRLLKKACSFVIFTVSIFSAIIPPV